MVFTLDNFGDIIIMGFKPKGGLNPSSQFHSVNAMQGTYYLNQQGVLDPTSTDLVIQMLRIANRGVHGEIIGQKYMDFASEAYPQIIDALDDCIELIKKMT